MTNTERKIMDAMTIGREYTYTDVHHRAGVGPETARRILRRLATAGVIEFDTVNVGGRGSTLYRRPASHAVVNRPVKTWDEVAREEMKRWGGVGGAVPGNRKGSDETPASDEVLDVLRGMGRALARDIAAKTGKSVATTSRTLARLVKIGVVEVIPVNGNVYEYEAK